MEKFYSSFEDVFRNRIEKSVLLIVGVILAVLTSNYFQNLSIDSLKELFDYFSKNGILSELTFSWGANVFMVVYFYSTSSIRLGGVFSLL